MCVQSSARKAVKFFCAVLVANGLATTAHRTAQGLDADGHMDLTRLADFSVFDYMPRPYGEWVRRYCFDDFVDGSVEPDRIRDMKPWINPSHQEDAKRRAGWSYCAAARTFREGMASKNVATICMAVRRLGRAFHYLQDWGDPSKQVRKARVDWSKPCILPGRDEPPHKYRDYLRQSFTCKARNSAGIIRHFAAKYAPKVRGKPFRKILDRVHQSRLDNGKILDKYSGGLPSRDARIEFHRALYETAGVLLAAQDEILRAFVDRQHNLPKPCDENPDDKIKDFVTVKTRDIRICVVDLNSILDDHYEMYVNHEYLGVVSNPVGGTTCYPARLRSGSNIVKLKLIEKMGKSTKLHISIYPGNYNSEFSGSKDHNWMITAP